MKQNNDPASLKRAIAGTLTQTILDILRSKEMDNDTLRLVIARFFTDDELMNGYLELITEADQKGVNLWDSEAFRLEFKNDLIKQFSKSVWKTRDSFAVLALMSGDYKPQKRANNGDAIPLEVLYGGS